MTEEGSLELTRHISGLIKDEGPLTFARFMECALYHPELGYYRSGQEVWGKSGDYITNADAGLIFTKMIARQIFEMWEVLGKPDGFTLVEVGGGRGLTLKGILVAFKEFHSELYALVKVVMVERSDNHIFDQLDGKPVHWYNDLKSVGVIESGVIFTNELLDALPFHRVVGDSGGLKELYVGIDRDSGGFVDIIGEPSTTALIDYFASLEIELSEAQEAEVSLNATGWISEAAAILKKGFLITIDYGYPARELYVADRGGTLLCHHRHTINDDPFRFVGTQDITAHVDFTSVVRAGLDSGLKLTGFTNQLSFLMGLDIAKELIEVTENISDSVKAISHNQSIKELIMPGGTGENFKVLVQHKGVESPMLSGFSFRDKKKLLK